jgi:FRG domain
MREIETVVVGSIESLLEEMVPKLGFQRIPIYRGQARASWTLLPMLYREEVARSEFKSWAELEAAFLATWKQRSGGMFPYEPVTELEWMALGAQFGLPTRCSAWSDNALVALFFATDPAHADEDGAVWRIMPGEANFTISQDYEQIPDQPRLFRPKRTDEAMRNQRVSYLSHPLPKEDASPETFEEVFELGSDRIVLSKLIIPAEWKSYLRRRLAMMGIDHQSMFPGAKGLCQDIRDEIYSHTDSYEWIFPE